MDNNEISIDYAVIGAGIAGTYCAWRLQKALGKKRKIVLFEHSNRIGGRLLTIRFPKSKLKAELGGMRYMPVQKVEGTDETIGHPIFSWLVEKEFRLETEDFPMGYIDDEEWGENNYVYFRGQHLKIKDLKVPEKSKVFNLDWSERGKSPNMLQEHVQKILVPGADKLNLQQWFDIKVFDEYLWKYGFWNLLYRVLSPEAYLLLKIGSGYDTNASNGNAVALLPILKDYLASTKYRTLKDGMMSLPERLAKEFNESLEGVIEKNCRIRLNRRLESIGEKDKDGFYELNFMETHTHDNKRQVTMDTGDYEAYESWKARNIILAIPTVALQKIKWEPLLRNESVIKLIDSVIPQEAIKLVLEYPYAWWKALTLFRGRSITDLPIRQTYYFSNLDDFKQVDPFEIKSDEPSLLMASYSDVESVPFWRGLEGTEEDELWEGHPSGYRASKIMVEEAHRQVMRIHGQYELPRPTMAAYYDWADSPFGAAWHCWKPGVRFDKEIDSIRKPVESEQVFICGEAYSALQGWAEGALNTAECLLQCDLEPADRLNPLTPDLTCKRTPKRARDLTFPSGLRVDSKGRRY